MKKPRIVSNSGAKPGGEKAVQSEPEESKSEAAEEREKKEKPEDPLLAVEPTESEKLSASEVCAPLPPSYYTASDLAGSPREPEPPQAKEENEVPRVLPAKKPRIIATYDYSLLSKK